MKQKIGKLRVTSFASPSEWEGNTDEGNSVYIRYNHGTLEAYVDEERIYCKAVGNELDSVMGISELTRHLQDVFNMSNVVEVWHDEPVTH